MKFIKAFVFFAVMSLLSVSSLSHIQAQAVSMPMVSQPQSTNMCATINTYLQKGSRGQDVLTLQKFLIVQQFLTPDANTGYFGSLTEAAVKAYQAQNSISPVGIVGPVTFAHLKAAMATSCTGEVAGVSFQNIALKRTTSTGSTGQQTTTNTGIGINTNTNTSGNSAPVDDHNPDIPLIVSCVGTPNPGLTGQTITWTATVSNAMDFPNFIWGGAAAGSPNAGSVTKTYTTTGVKTATLIVSTGSQAGSAECSVQINGPTNQPLAVTCSSGVESGVVVTPATVMWTATATGGTGNYTYTWGGSGGLAGNSSSVVRFYDHYMQTGMNSASVLVSDGVTTKSAHCGLLVTGDSPYVTIGILHNTGVACSATAASVFPSQSISLVGSWATAPSLVSYGWQLAELREPPGYYPYYIHGYSTVGTTATVPYNALIPIHNGYGLYEAMFYITDQTDPSDTVFNSAAAFCFFRDGNWTPVDQALPQPTGNDEIVPAQSA